MEINLDGFVAWLLIVPSFVVYLLGFLMIIDRLLLYFDKFLKHVTTQCDLWGIMRQTGKNYYQNKNNGGCTEVQKATPDTPKPPVVKK